MLLGFSDGALHKNFTNRLDRYSPNYINSYFFNALEIHCQNEKTMDYIIYKLDKKLYVKFKYLSLHAPEFYKKSEKNVTLLKKIRLIYNKLKIKNIVIHPNNLFDWDILDKFNDLPLSIENMDNDKKSFKFASDFEKIVYKKKLNITLDLNHAHTNDFSLNLAKIFHKKFKDKIVEYHISGYNKKEKHIPLFKSQQLEILKSLKFKNLPIIIESSFENFSSLKKEYLFIKNNL